MSLGEHSIDFAYEYGNEILVCKYKYMDSCYSAPEVYAPYIPFSNAMIVAIDPMLNERCQHKINAIANHYYNGDDFDDDGINDGVKLVSIGDNEYPGTWRAIFSADDNCWRLYRRDHSTSRMLASNDKKGSFPYSIFISYVPKGEEETVGFGHISIGVAVNYDYCRSRFPGVFTSKVPRGLHGVWSFGSYPDLTNMSVRQIFYDSLVKGEHLFSFDAILGVKFIPTKVIDNHQFTVYGNKWINAFKETENGEPKHTFEIPSTAAKCNEAIERVFALLSTEGRDHFRSKYFNLPLGDRPIPNMSVSVELSGELVNYKWTLGSDYDCVHFADSISDLRIAYLPWIGTPIEMYPWQYSDLIEVLHIDWIRNGTNRLQYPRGVRYRDRSGIENCACASCTINRNHARNGGVYPDEN